MFQNFLGAFVHDDKSNQGSNAVGLSSFLSLPAGSSLRPANNNSSNPSTLSEDSSIANRSIVGGNKQQEEKEEAVDEDEVAGSLLAQFPTYGEDR
jgi:hypothetical protein